MPESIEKRLGIVRMKFMAEDTATGLIQEWLNDYKGDYVCTKLIYNEAYKMLGEPDRKMISEINDIMNNTVEGWAEGPQHRFPMYGQQRSWKRIQVSVSCDGELPPGFEGILDAGEQISIPFDDD